MESGDARIRTGHATELAEYRARIGRDESGVCDLCAEEEQTTVHLMMRCPAMHSRRRRTFECEATIETLVKEPDKCRRLLNRMLKLEDEDDMREDDEGDEEEEDDNDDEGDDEEYDDNDDEGDDTPYA